MGRGLLIVFEGSEGAGKTTQLRLLRERIEAEGIECLSLREPGGTELGDSIRGVLLDPLQHITGTAEALLFMASRAQLVADRIDPELTRGVVVLMDRFFLSTYAYQIFGRGLPEEGVRAANALATRGLVPDLTVVIDVPAREGMTRASARGEQDRIEQLGDDFHDRVEAAFARFAQGEWQRSHPECGSIVSVDGRGAPKDVQSRVIEALAQNLPERFSMLSTTKRL